MYYERNTNAPCPDLNKHCGDLDPIGASIQSDVLTFIIVAGILVYMWRIFKRSNKL